MNDLAIQKEIFDTDKVTALCIAKWSSEFETDKSRNSKKGFSWHKMPIEPASTGMIKMLEDFGDRKLEMYGAWALLLQFAASRVPSRGVLLDSKGQPIQANRICVTMHCDISQSTVFDELIQWSQKPSVGWLVRREFCLSQWIESEGIAMSDYRATSGRPPDALQDKTRHNKTLDDIRQHMSSSGCRCIDFSGLSRDDVETKVKRFRDLTGITKSQVSIEALTMVIAIDATFKCGMLQSLQQEFKLGGIRKPSRYVATSLANKSEEFGFNLPESETACGLWLEGLKRII